VPQDLAIYPDLTTKENLEAFGRFHGLRGGVLRQSVDWALQWTGLADRSHHQPKTFSGGMKRRVNIACGVMHRPHVVLLDEPTVGVDPQSRERIFQMLEDLRQDGTSILLTTHHLDEAETQCDRIVIIDHGRVIADGTLNELVGETIGMNRRVTVRLTQPLQSSNGFAMDETLTEVKAEIGDVVRELPELLAKINEEGGQIDDVEVRPPSLHAVFLHLTGRELRE
jgi:ABC-2 type transport system ATP-binding protein